MYVICNDIVLIDDTAGLSYKLELSRESLELKLKLNRIKIEYMEVN